ncbi:hypothetical protein AX17_004839 [Amanita inopinata Kibby_2008]|nr:hypothetical protein AX17_004839 [Amanita inopinata Kibby_2008]
MPRIRKKTSRRKSTNDRRKIQQKARESRKKKTKETKKNPQWKSKHKKDPGIPNDFPYKEQILAEVAEQRRLAAEEKERRKEEKKALKAAGKAGNKVHDEAASGSEQSDVVDGEQDEGRKIKLGSKIGSDGIASLSAKTVSASKLRERGDAMQVEGKDEDQEEEVPALVNRDLPNLRAVLEEVDVLVEVLDARDPLAFRSRQLEKLMTAENKKVLLVLNKIDTCPRESVATWAAHLRMQYPTLLFRSATTFLPSSVEQLTSKGKGKQGEKKSVINALGIDSVLECLGQWSKEKSDDRPLSVGVVGLTNSGKSSFLNSLLRRSALPVYSLTSSNTGPSTTVLPQEVTIEASGRQIRFIDTPGLTWSPDKHAENQGELLARDILLRSKGRIDRLKDPIPVVAHIVSRSNPEDLMLLYNLPAFPQGDHISFLSSLARLKSLVKKKGELDLQGACKTVLTDWSTRKFPRYTMPSSSGGDTLIPDDMLRSLYDRDESVFESLRTRKEMRRAGGLVKLSASEMELREVALEEPYMKEEDQGEDEESDEDEMSAGSEEMEDSDINAEETEDAESDMDEGMEEASDKDAGDEYEAVSQSLSKRQKRKRMAEPAPNLPSKKVTFATEPRGTKQARVALSSKADIREKPAIPKKISGTPKASKTSARPRVSVKSSEPSAKVANTAGSKAKLKSAEKGAAGEQGYDFGKYF